MSLKYEPASVTTTQRFSGQVPLSIDLGHVYTGLGPSRYRLRSIVCYYAKHYVLIAYRPRIKKWVLLDDSLVSPSLYKSL